jgi:hypothetical protein
VTSGRPSAIPAHAGIIAHCTYCGAVVATRTAAGRGGVPRQCGDRCPWASGP